MKTIHYTKSALEAEKALYVHYQADCMDYEHCNQYQETIDAIDYALRYGSASDFSTNTLWIMDRHNFTFDLEDYYQENPIKIKDCDIGLNTLKA